MKNEIKQITRALVRDRYVAILLTSFLVLCVASIVFIAINIRVSELQVVVHYTGFGSTNFYRDRWYYLFTFIVFVVLMAAMHSIISYKLLESRGRDLTLAFLWLSITVIIIAVSLFYQIFKIASLS